MPRIVYSAAGVRPLGRDDHADKTGQAIVRPITGGFVDREGRLASGAVQAAVCLAVVMRAVLVEAWRSGGVVLPAGLLRAAVAFSAPRPGARDATWDWARKPQSVMEDQR